MMSQSDTTYFVLLKETCSQKKDRYFTLLSSFPEKNCIGLITFHYI